MAKYVDIPAIMQIIAGVYVNNELLEDERYHFSENDFPEDFHKILFGSIYNLHQLGAKDITPEAIDHYLQSRPKQYGIYRANKGIEYLQKLTEIVQLATFDYYYSRMKKMTLLRMYSQVLGMDLSWLYDPDEILNIKKKQAQEDWFDNTSIEEMADIINEKIDNIRQKCVDGELTDINQASQGLANYLEELKRNPEYGFPMYGPFVNTIFRGARLKKLYIRSGSTGTGKTRTMIADACTFSCAEIYDKDKGKWEVNPCPVNTLYITTEQELGEVQTMLIAFVADIDEQHIVTGQYEVGEWERVEKAIKIIEEAKLYIKELPDFSLQDIESVIKRAVQEYNVKCVCHDYIHTSMKILSEISSRAGVKGLREDNVLFMIAVRLKDLANQYGIFILTGTQLNGDFKTAKELDQSVLRGAKAIADKADVGMIMVKVTDDDREALKTLVAKGYTMPDIKISVYKNRGNSYKDIILWCKSKRESCRIIPMFITDLNYELLDIEDTKIIIEPREELCG